jgi:hypothetical protein
VGFLKIKDSPKKKKLSKRKGLPEKTKKFWGKNKGLISRYALSRYQTIRKNF